MADQTIADLAALTDDERQAIREAWNYDNLFHLYLAVGRVITARVAEAKAEAWAEGVTRMHQRASATLGYFGNIEDYLDGNPYLRDDDPRHQHEWRAFREAGGGKHWKCLTCGAKTDSEPPTRDTEAMS